MTNAAGGLISGAYDGIGIAMHRGAGTVVNYGRIASTGRRVDAASRSDVRHVFHLPALPTTVRIVSRTGVPQEMGLARDPRCLGVALRQIMVTRGAQIRTIEAEDAQLADGFHGYEADNDIRWTDGDAAVPAVVFESFAGPLEIALRLGGSTSYPDEGTLLQAA